MEEMAGMLALDIGKYKYWRFYKKKVYGSNSLMLLINNKITQLKCKNYKKFIR